MKGQLNFVFFSVLISFSSQAFAQNASSPTTPTSDSSSGIIQSVPAEAQPSVVEQSPSSNNEAPAMDPTGDNFSGFVENAMPLPSGPNVCNSCATATMVPLYSGGCSMGGNQCGCGAMFMNVYGGYSPPAAQLWQGYTGSTHTQYRHGGYWGQGCRSRRFGRCFSSGY